MRTWFVAGKAATVFFLQPKNTNHDMKEGTITVNACYGNLLSLFATEDECLFIIEQINRLQNIAMQGKDKFLELSSDDREAFCMMNTVQDYTVDIVRGLKK